MIEMSDGEVDSSQGPKKCVVRIMFDFEFLITRKLENYNVFQMRTVC